MSKETIFHFIGSYVFLIISGNMKHIYLIICLIIISGFSLAYCRKSFNKRGCVSLGSVCDKPADCCGQDDPHSGHCILCTRDFNIFAKKRCACDVTGSVAIDLNGTPLSDMCDGRDRFRENRCRTRVIPPGHIYYREKGAGKN